MSIIKNILFCNLICFIFGMKNLQAQGAPANIEAQQKLKQVNKQFFIENKGQWPKEVLYLTQSAGLNTWITTKGMWYEFYKTEEMNPVNKLMPNEFVKPEKFEHTETKRWGHRVGYTLVGNNKSVKTETKQKQEGYYNYFIGNDPSKHASSVGLYKEILVTEVYKGIDMRYYFDKGQLRYDYVIEPGADPSQICFKFEGAENSYINEKGELVFTSCFGEVKNADLYTFQQKNKMQVTSKFIKTDEGFGFDVDNYSKSQTLIIDPLIYSTFIGGNSSDAGTSIAINSVDNAHITGYTTSTIYDITPGAFQTIYAGGSYDVFVSKLNSSGTALIYSTFIGGSGDDSGYGIALDASNNAYITGFTSSTNYDITPGAFQTTYGGGAYDVFVSKLNSTGTALIYSTYIGGSNFEYGFSIALDASGNSYITGLTWSNNFDITAGAFQTTLIGGGGMVDAFVTKLNATGTSLIYSTYLGGSNRDIGYSIALDLSNNAYITGYTYSANFDITPGAFQTTYGGGLCDVFVTKLNSNGSSLIYSTYIGGSGQDLGNSIVLDDSHNAYLTGRTSSIDYDITPGAFQTTFAGINDVFVTQLNNIGTMLIYSSYIGGSQGDGGIGIVIDGAANAYITGITSSANYAITPMVFKSIKGIGSEVFVTKLALTNALPIKLIEFSGTQLQNTNEITWKTAAELNFSHYELESAEDGIHFKILDTIMSFGNSNDIKCYTYQDKNYYSPITYYRLKSVDLDGSYNYSKIISIKPDENNGSSIVISPNPSQGLYQIDFGNGANGFIQLEVVDMQGNLIEKQNLSNKNSTSIDLSKYASGVYILKVIANNKQEIARLVKL